MSASRDWWGCHRGRRRTLRLEFHVSRGSTNGLGAQDRRTAECLKNASCLLALAVQRRRPVVLGPVATGQGAGGVRYSSGGGRDRDRIGEPSVWLWPVSRRPKRRYALHGENGCAEELLFRPLKKNKERQALGV